MYTQHCMYSVRTSGFCIVVQRYEDVTICFCYNYTYIYCSFLWLPHVHFELVSLLCIVCSQHYKCCRICWRKSWYWYAAFMPLPVHVPNSCFSHYPIHLLCVMFLLSFAMRMLDFVCSFCAPSVHRHLKIRSKKSACCYLKKVVHCALICKMSDHWASLSCCGCLPENSSVLCWFLLHIHDVLLLIAFE